MNMLALVISFFLSTLSFLVSIYTTIFQTRVDENCKLLRRVHLQSSGSKTRIQLQYLLPCREAAGSSGLWKHFLLKPDVLHL